MDTDLECEADLLMTKVDEQRSAVLGLLDVVTDAGRGSSSCRR